MLGVASATGREFGRTEMNDIVVKLSEFLTKELNLSESDLAPGTPLFSTGLIDSFALVTLLGHIEKAFGVHISATDVSLENFDTLDRIEDYVKRSLGV